MIARAPGNSHPEPHRMGNTVFNPSSPAFRATAPFSRNDTNVQPRQCNQRILRKSSLPFHNKPPVSQAGPLKAHIEQRPTGPHRWDTTAAGFRQIFIRAHDRRVRELEIAFAGGTSQHNLSSFQLSRGVAKQPD